MPLTQADKPLATVPQIGLNARQTGPPEVGPMTYGPWGEHGYGQDNTAQ
jgi:hypothetical protein